MKKGSVRFCGIITLFFSIIFIVIGVFFAGDCFNIEVLKNLVASGIFNTIYSVAYSLFIFPLQSLLSGVLESNLLLMILTILFLLLALGSFFWGIKEIAISRRDDQRFAKAKKTTGFASLLKLIFMLYILAVVVGSFVLEGFSTQFEEINALVGLNYALQIIGGVLTIIALLCFALPIGAYKKASKIVNQDNNQNYNEQYQDGQGYYAQEAYQDQYYNYQQTTPIDPTSLIYNEQVNQGDSFRLIPGQDGIPYNITQKGLEDLARLERLRASGAIDDRNYEALKHKICSTNLS